MKAHGRRCFRDVSVNRLLHEASSSRGLCLVAAAAFLLVKGQPVDATPESRASALFLLISPSVRLNGMGQAGVALADEPASYYNPGAAALSSPRHTFQGRFYLREMPWLPAGVEDMTYRHHAAQVAGGRVFDGLSRRGPTRLRAAFYGYRTRLIFGRVRVNETGEMTGSLIGVEEASDNVGVSLALRSVVEVGAGAVLKRISSRWGDAKGAADACDFGLMAVVPMTRALESLSGRELALNRHLRVQLDIGFGVSWQNRGGATINYTGQSLAPLPANRRHGWSAVLAIDRSSDSLGLPLGRMTFSGETYRPQVEGSQVTSRAEDDKWGVEISFLETISFRWGKYDDIDGSVHLKTSGRTIQSDGLFRYMAHHLESQPPGSGRDGLLFLLRRLSVSWSWFRYDPERPPIFRRTRHSSLGLSF